MVDPLAVTIEFFTIGVSVRLSNRFNVTQNKINFVKNCPQWGWKPGPPDLQASALPTELSQHSVASLNLHCFIKSCSIDHALEMNKVQHVKWCMKQTKLTSEIS